MILIPPAALLHPKLSSSPHRLCILHLPVDSSAGAGMACTPSHCCVFRTHRAYFKQEQHHGYGMGNINRAPAWLRSFLQHPFFLPWLFVLHHARQFLTRPLSSISFFTQYRRRTHSINATFRRLGELTMYIYGVPCTVQRNQVAPASLHIMMST